VNSKGSSTIFPFETWFLIMFLCSFSCYNLFLRGESWAQSVDFGGNNRTKPMTEIGENAERSQSWNE
jgi:hypothetical protein